MKYYQYHDVHFRGTIQRVDYTTTDSQGETRAKYANVYLPFGYDAADKEKKYNVLYLMHGGGGNPDAWLDCCKIKNMLDYCFDAGEAEPFIVVFPSFYKQDLPREGVNAQVEQAKVLEFLPELTAQLLPAVEGRYNTYAEGCSDEQLRAARAHRGFGGFSMGSCVTWYNFLRNLPYFRTFLPLSGDCWEVAIKAGEAAAAQTAECLKNAAQAAGLEFCIFAATGSKDPAFEAMAPQIEAMKQYPEVFAYSDQPDGGNFHFFVAEGEVHAYESVYQYLYNYLPYLFR